MNEVLLDKKILSDIVDKSGYPFQIAVQNLIQTTRRKNEHDWNVIEHEYPWYNFENKTKGYIDLIIGRGSIKLIIECKRVLKNPNWIFLNTSQKPQFEAAYGLRVGHRLRAYAVWDKFIIQPPSIKSEFCIFETKERRIIETDIGILIDAIEAYSLTDINRIKSDLIYHTHSEEAWFVPIIVTTATLVDSKIDPNKINFTNGKIKNDDLDFQTVSCVRFEKSIKTNHMSESNFYSERGLVTCFIININNLISILKMWNTDLFNKFNG
jgi:hypothetical protein